MLCLFKSFNIQDFSPSDGHFSSSSSCARDLNLPKFIVLTEDLISLNFTYLEI